MTSTTLKNQRIRYASNGGYTTMYRTVHHVTEELWVSSKGYITWLGGTYRVRLVDGPAGGYWSVDGRVQLYPAGHPLEILNPPEFRQEAAR